MNYYISTYHEFKQRTTNPNNVPTMHIPTYRILLRWRIAYPNLYHELKRITNRVIMLEFFHCSFSKESSHGENNM